MVRPRINGRAIKTDDVWSLQSCYRRRVAKIDAVPVQTAWSREHQDREAWNQWVKSTRRQTVHLLVNEFGLAITKAQDLQEFKEACIQPPQTDRSGTAAEVTLQDVVTQLQQHWADTFQASAVVWRLWANNISRNLNRSAWADSISQPPTDHIVPMLNAADTHLEQHLTDLNRSARLALDCVTASMTENTQFQRDFDVLGRRLEVQKNSLLARKEIIGAFIRELPPPPQYDVIDPLPLIDNVDDTEHEE